MSILKPLTRAADEPTQTPALVTPGFLPMATHTLHPEATS